MAMRIKKFDVVRLPYECETDHPALARLIVLSKTHKLVKFRRIQIVLNGKECCNPLYRLYIPKIKYIKGGDAL